MIQRRWFLKLRKASLLLKEKRKLMTDAAIFRFLSLQRKALVAWQFKVDGLKKEKIKRHFAVALYYTRTLDKAFSALRLNRYLNKKKREIKEKGMEFLDSETSEDFNTLRRELDQRHNNYYRNISGLY